MRVMMIVLTAGLIGLGLWADAIRAENATTNIVVQTTKADDEKAKVRPRAVRKPEKRLDAKSRAAAAAFARKHHPELARLLTVLRKADTQNYAAALRELAFHADRLGKMAERDDERYAVSLELWKLESRFRLLVARLTMAGEAEIDAKVRPMLVERARLKLELLQLEEKRTVARLERLQEQIAVLSSASDDRIAAEIEKIRRTIVRGQRAKTSRTEPASQETVRPKASSRKPTSK